MIKRKRWMIYDWTGQCLEAHGSFISFDSAENYLSQWLDEAYDTDRQEYYIVPVSWL